MRKLTTSCHSFGGSVAQIAAVVLGAQGIANACHNFGALPVFNGAAAGFYNNMFPAQWGAGMRTIANGDSTPGLIPLSAGYTFVDGAFWCALRRGGRSDLCRVYGTNATFGQNYAFESNTFAGGNVAQDA